MSNDTTHTVKLALPENVGALLKAIADNHVPEDAGMRFITIRGDRPFDSDAHYVEFTWTVPS